MKWYFKSWNFRTLLKVFNFVFQQDFEIAEVLVSPPSIHRHDVPVMAPAIPGRALFSFEDSRDNGM